MRRQGRPRRSNTPGSRPKRIARLARSAIPQSRSAASRRRSVRASRRRSVRASRRRSVRASRPDPHMALFTEAARPTTMLYVLSMPRRQRSRETKRQYFPPCDTLVAPSIAFDGWLRSRIRRGRQILPSFATTVGAFPRPELSGWPRLTSAVCGEYARKLLRVRRFRWSQACSLGTVYPSRKLPKVRILHLPPRAERALDLRNRRVRGPLHVLVGGMETAVDEAVITAVGRRPVTCAHA